MTLRKATKIIKYTLMMKLLSYRSFVIERYAINLMAFSAIISYFHQKNISEYSVVETIKNQCQKIIFSLTIAKSCAI